MKTENLKVGDVLIAKRDDYSATRFTKGKEYEITYLKMDEVHYINDLGIDNWSIIDLIEDAFTLKETPKGKHTGYIAPMDYFFWAIKKGDIIKQTQSVNTTYLINTFPIPKELVESWEKYYKPVEEKITIGGVEVKIDFECETSLTGRKSVVRESIQIDNCNYNIYGIKHILQMIKTEPNLVPKLELIINKVEGK